jgi:glycosidase
LLLGEEETPDLALKPFALDYGWWLYDALKTASNGGDASKVQAVWRHQTDAFPPGMKHMAIQDDWDYPRDVDAFGGPDGALAAAAFDFTDTGVPLVYNGMEIGNAAGGVNPHAPIDWAAVNPQFPSFYHQIIALRHRYPALQQGAMTWLSNSVPSQVLTYERIGGGSEFLIEINLSSAPARGVVQGLSGSRWKEFTPAAAPGAGTHPAPPEISLPPKGFAIFRRASF